MNKQIKLKFNKDYLLSIVKNKFIDMAKDENLWDKVDNNFIENLEPICIYSIYSGLERENGILKIGDYELKSSVFNSIPKEILGECAVFIISIKDKSDSKGILDETLNHMIKVAFLEGMRDLLRQELQEDYLVGSYFAPGIGDMPVEEIATFTKLVDFVKAGVDINDSFIMIPEKSMVGMYMFFSESHPESHNSCDTCMSRGYGCNLCSVERE